MNNLSNARHNTPEAVQNYLRKYGLTNWEVEPNIHHYYNSVIVVPAICEYENIRKLFGSLLKCDRKYFQESLFLFVINNLSSSDDEVKKNNHKSLELLSSTILRKKYDELSNKINSAGINVAYIDAATEKHELPEKEGGVGLARKIGMDSALKKFDYSNSRKKILISLDADCTVEPNYLTEIVESFNRDNLNAAYIQFEHQLPENENEKHAIVCYEIFLRYYVLGLQYANSPFAFPTIGSIIACDYESYIKVGGMNKRKAGEDFYFMEKLAKRTSIKKIRETKVYPAGRISWRVPFGTGPRISRFLEGTHDEYVLFEPQIFVVLKRWLDVFNSERILTHGQYLDNAKSIHPALHDFLLLNKFEENWAKILHGSKMEEQINKQKMIWFDGFKTLKMIHYLRDNGFFSVNMFDALDKFFSILGPQIIEQNDRVKITRSDSVPSFEIQMEYLSLLRNLT